MRLLMCRPKYYGIHYEINPWMHVKNHVDSAQAQTQWDGLYKTLLSCGAVIDLIGPVQEWPDMVFTANAGLYIQNKIVLPHFKYPERQGELPYFKAWFQNAGFEFWNELATTEGPYFEGAGDALSAGNKLFVGFGFRSDKRFYEEASYLKPLKLTYCELIDPYYYHIDTCFCPLDDHSALWYPWAFSQASQNQMRDEIELVAVTSEEARNFACNSVVLGKDIVLPDACPKITSELKKRGYRVHHCKISEFLKAGGACKCLTLRID